MDIQFVLCLVSGFLEILMAGVIYGWTSLEWVLQQEKYFAYLCENASTGFVNTSQTNVSSTSLNCDKQKASFNLVFTLGISLLFVMLLPFGYILDRLGTWVFRCIASIMFTIGFVLVAVSTPATSWLLFPSMIFLGVSGIGLLTSNLQIANLAPNMKGVIITFLCGAFDSSAIIFFLIKITYENGFDFNQFFHILAWCSLLPWLRTFLFMPKKSIPYILPEISVKYGWKQWTYCKNAEGFKNKSKEKTLFSKLSTNKSEQETGTIHYVQELEPKTVTTQYSKESESFVEKVAIKKISYFSCLKKTLFWTNVFHFSVISFRVGFYFSSFITWLESFETDENVSYLTNVFGIMVFFGATCAPFNGLIIDGVVKYYKRKVKNVKILNLRGSFASMLTTSTLSILLSVSVIIPNTYISFVGLLLTRGFVYGGNAAFVATAFPTNHLGKLYGLTNFIGGLISFLQYGLFQIALAYDPTFVYINIGLLVVMLLSLIHPLLIFKKSY